MNTQYKSTIELSDNLNIWFIYRMPNRDVVKTLKKENKGFIKINPENNRSYYHYDDFRITFGTMRKLEEILIDHSLTNRTHSTKQYITDDFVKTDILDTIAAGDSGDIENVELEVRPYEEPVLNLYYHHDGNKHIFATLDLPTIMFINDNMRMINSHFAYYQDGQYMLTKNAENNSLEISAAIENGNYLIASSQNLDKIQSISDLQIETKSTGNGRLNLISESIIENFKKLEDLHNAVIIHKLPLFFHAKPKYDGLLNTMLSSSEYNDWLPWKAIYDMNEILGQNPKGL